MENVAVYLRVSTKAQTGKDKFGMLKQFEDCRAFCKSEGYKIVAVYRDKGISGTLQQRPGLTKAFEGAKDKKFTKVIVAKLDRVARDLAVQLWVDKELLIHNVEMISVAEPFSQNDYMMNAMRQIVGVFAELEKNRIAERLQGGREVKRKKGGFIGGQVPLGYTLENKRLLIEETKAHTIKRAYELRNTTTLKEIARILNKEGHTTRDGKIFSPMQVKRIFDREDLYTGRLQAPAIV
ncbi:hypothetical protein FZC84_21350 [Rossellomorea vietnamensis]|uniref:Resolvase/invertase-type recombinase catalytic domain-containing protein n=1 Tax=Rossellomorea vietnamensis TaxID=218284 RepID=A0A5D4M2I5_9BACI|nr:recombinase family protein [Rossellomorea vietnamensis]TYR95741.1 hypothetical protein FZC84_21350 [Rossellomorea vietnamensis]